MRKVLSLIWTTLIASFVLGPLILMTLYAFSGQWNAPALLPQEWTFRHFDYLFTYENGWGSLLLSLSLALVTTALALAVGVPAAYGLTRYSSRGRSLFQAINLMKTSIPVVVIGIGTAGLFVSWDLVDSFPGLVLAHLSGCLPLVIWTAASAFESLDARLEEAARNCGANWWQVALTIHLPLASRGVLSASILAFLYSMDEFTITFLVSNVHMTTLPVRLYSVLQQGSLEPAAAAGLVLLFPSIAYLLFISLYLKPQDLSSETGS